MGRRTLILLAISLAGFCLTPAVKSAAEQADPWSQAELLPPADLVSQLQAPERPVVISVAFPFLYRQKHIVHAQFAGPTSKPEGIEALKQAVTHVPKDAEIVIYCGCCPMVKCPNVRPAYTTLKQLGYSKVRVLDLTTDFHTDWTAKGYPVEP
jgi:thiosulfate/3-mercaptopyruvate sulfurtransferase